MNNQNATQKRKDRERFINAWTWHLNQLPRMCDFGDIDNFREVEAMRDRALEIMEDEATRTYGPKITTPHMAFGGAK